MDIESFLRFFTLVIGFYMAWNIGANDVANAMGTSVGSKALTLKKAVIIAAFLEFGGAYFIGATVSETIQKGIVDPNTFADNPLVFATGMIGSLLAAGVWLQLASYFGLPVSTTHAIVGAVVGFGAVIGGVEAVKWNEILFISFSWILSPILSGFFAYFLFHILQRNILFALNPLEATKKLAPVFIFFVIFVLSLSVIYNGLHNLNLHLSFGESCLFSACLGVLAFVISTFLVRKISVRAFEFSTSHHPQQVVSLEKAIKHVERVNLSTSDDETKDKSSLILHELVKLNDNLKHKTQFTKRISSFTEVEKVFVYLQILSACMIAFAHGANDVANAIGPIAAVMHVLNTGSVLGQSQIPAWLLAFGGLGIVIGLATWGWRVIETIGKKITELTPTRGFCAEFGAATTILIATKFGLPISTTHALVGAVLGVGLARGLTALNLRTLRDILLSWIITIPACGVISIIIYWILRAIIF